MDGKFHVLKWYVFYEGDEASQAEQDQRHDQRRGEAAVCERELGAPDHGLEEKRDVKMNPSALDILDMHLLGGSECRWRRIASVLGRRGRRRM
jgi:hypothetical protein